MQANQNDPLPRLADALYEVGTRLHEITAELRAMAATREAPTPQPVAVPLPPPPLAPPRLPAPMPAQRMPPSQPPPVIEPLPPAEPVPTLWERLSKDGAGSRILAWAGGVVTLLGVVLLLILAIQRGYLGPLPRVLLGAALGSGLVGIGLRLHRNQASRVGAFAVAATGFAVLYLDVIAATTLYRYLPSFAGLLLGLAVAGAGVWLASRWQVQLFAVFVVVACACCAPVLTNGFTALLLEFLLVLMVATTPVQLRNAWSGLATGAGLPPAIASTATILLAKSAPYAPTPPVSAAVLALATTGLVIALATVTAARGLADEATSTLLAIAPAPALLATILLSRMAGAGLATVVSGLLLIVWLLDRSGLLRLPSRFVLTAGAACVLALFQATLLAVHGGNLAVVLLAESVLFGLLSLLVRRTAMLVPAAGYGIAGLLAALTMSLPPSYLGTTPHFRPAAGELATAGGTGVLLVIAVSLLATAASRLGMVQGPDAQPVPWLAAAAMALYGASGAVLTIGLLISPDRTGFLGGHVLVTLSWTVAALVLLVRGIDQLPVRVTGLVLVGAALAKLVLFDLSALDGLARVAAFLGAGLVLLAAGARYARLVAGRQLR